MDYFNFFLRSILCLKIDPYTPKEKHLKKPNTFRRKALENNGKHPLEDLSYQN